MSAKRIVLLGAILLTFALAACSAPAAPADSMMKKESPPADAMMKKDAPTADAMMKKESPTVAAMMDKTTTATPAWFSANLTDVNTGKSFQIADFKGKVVLVETMAVWCSTCLQQQKQVQALHQLVKRDDLVSIALDIDPNENDATLKAHAAKNSFDWKYAVAPAIVSREIGNLYGAQFLNPPSAPMFVIDREGKAHLLPFGVKSAQDLKTAVETYLKAGM